MQGFLPKPPLKVERGSWTLRRLAYGSQLKELFLAELHAS